MSWDSGFITCSRQDILLCWVQPMTSSAVHCTQLIPMRFSAASPSSLDAREIYPALLAVWLRWSLSCPTLSSSQPLGGGHPRLRNIMPIFAQHGGVSTQATPPSDPPPIANR
eukprot:9233512-Pyramimonas_sp.AAC.1